MPDDPIARQDAPFISRNVSFSRRDAAFDLQAPERPLRWYRVARAVAKCLAATYSHMEIEGAQYVSTSPAVYCFSHQCWVDPMYVLAAAPARPRMYFFGPQEADMRRGVRNRLMRFFGLVIPFAPGARGLLAATQRAVRLAGEGASIGIAGEGRIHCGESVVLPLKDGPAYIALRAGIPLVPVALNGTGWLGFRRRVRVRFGAPIEAVAETSGRPQTAEVAALTARAQTALELLVGGFDDEPPPGRVGRWLTEMFNGWPGGKRPSPGSPLDT